MSRAREHGAARANARECLSSLVVSAQALERAGTCELDDEVYVLPVRARNGADLLQAVELPERYRYQVAAVRGDGAVEAIPILAEVHLELGHHRGERVPVEPLQRELRIPPEALAAKPESERSEQYELQPGPSHARQHCSLGA